VPEYRRRLSRIQLYTYREKFSSLPRSNITTDKGWGCLIRTSQMLLAETLKRHSVDEFDHRWFRDDTDAIFSIHSLVRAVANPDAPFRADYWSPSLGCDAIRKVLARAPLSRKLRAYVVESGTAYNEEVCRLLQDGSSLLFLAPIRACYRKRIHIDIVKTVQCCLRFPASVGIIGGTPKRSYYIVGFMNKDRLIYVDPHCATQAAFRDDGQEGCHLATDHQDALGTVDGTRIDSSLVFGFYLRSDGDWEALKHFLSAGWADGERLITVCESRAEENSKIDDILTWD
jgi:cysteine protease ATG4